MKITCATLLLLSFFLLSCQKEITDTILSNNNDVISRENQRLDAKIGKQTTQSWLNGYVVNEVQQPIAGAIVECGGKTTTTDSKGFYFFTSKLTVNKDYAVIKVSKPGYLNGFRTFTPNRSQLAYRTEKIMLQVESTPGQVAATGGDITIDNIKLSFPANAVVRSDGTAYSGNITVIARYINPGSPGFPLTAPGMLSGLNDADQIRSLQSLGMAHVELKDASGADLEIAAGKTVKMELPAAAGSPATIPLWHFNEKYGIWIQQGTATKQNNLYIAEVNHFSIWNLDIEFNNFELTLKFQTPALAPVSNLRVDVYRPNNSLVIGFNTDNAGEATLINCSSSETLTLKISYPCDTLTYTLPPVTQTRTDIITVNSPAVQSYQFSGTLFSCNNQALTNQPFQLLLSNNTSFFVVTGITDAQGRINAAATIPNCAGNTLNAQTVAYYNNRFFYSSTTSVQPGANNYNATLCDSIGNGGNFNDSDIVNLPDPNLRQKVREVINKPTGNIYYADVKNVTTLRAYTIQQVQTLMGLQYFTRLDTLELSPINGVVHSFTDLNPIRTLTTLRVIDFGRGSLTDISPLQNLTALTELYLANNQIADITPLQGLTNLTTLWVPANPVQNISPIQNLTRLKDLWLNQCGITDISSLQSLNSLVSLNLSDNPVANISALQNKPQLSVLSLSRCQVADITPLQNLSALFTLRLDSNRITNIAPIQNLSALNYLDLSDNLITNLISFNNCATLRTVDLSDNQISSIALLQGHPGISSLNLRNNLITDISPLQNITTLLSLALDGNSIGNLAPLGGINRLQQLYLYNNNLTNITPLITSNPNLIRFYILQGNTIPPAEITSFQTTHPSCQVF